MSGTAPAVAPAEPAAPAADPAPAAQGAAPAVGAPADGSAEPSPAPAPSPFDKTILDTDPPAPAEAAPAEPPAPIDPASYEVQLPEGMTREDPMVSAFLEAAAGQRLEGAAVQSVLDKMAPLVAEQLAAPMKAWSDLNTEWQAQIKADPDYAGDKLSAAASRIVSAMDRFGSPELKAAMSMTGAANNPAIFKFLDKVTAAYAEATPVAAGSSSFSAPPAVQQALNRMYPSAAQPNGAA
jgi:hypothetical protein